jgi:hypothetical protein
MNFCLNCCSVINKKNKYCNTKCQSEHEYIIYIRLWLDDLVDGMRGLSDISNHIRRYLFEKYDSKCQQCGWGVVHKHTGRVPLQIDHIDGDYKNNKPNNLRLLCPNCHALTDNFGSLNTTGKGRRSIGIKYESKAALAQLVER